MLNRKKPSLAVGLVTWCIVVIFISAVHNEIYAAGIMPKEDIKTVTLKQEPEGINPNTLKVNLGTTIVWFNNDKEPVTIKFINKLGIACKAPVNFYSDLMGYYESTVIPEGGTASICFIYEGDYAYEVRRLVTNEKGEQIEEISSGKIIAIE